MRAMKSSIRQCSNLGSYSKSTNLCLAAAAYRSDVLKNINLLSEGEVVEDVDVSWKITKAGFSIIGLPENAVYHKGPKISVVFKKSHKRWYPCFNHF